LSSQDVLRNPAVPACLRICAGTDGSVTQLLEVLTGKRVKVITLKQHVIKASPDIAELLEIETGKEVNSRLVTLNVDKTIYVLAKSLAPIERLPAGVKEDIMRADVPIGRILREHGLETRRDILGMKIINSKFFGDTPVLSREYRIVYKNEILMWINECFPVDDRWT
jgi:chorismate-pyruvate lyase